MKKHPCLRTCVVALLTVTLSVACVPSALALAEGDAASSSSASAASASSAATYEKSEVVYATLAASGAPKAVYVVNRFDVEVPGTVVDHGDYTSVQNLTNETELARIGDATTFEAEAGTLYYQGDAANAALPWNVSLSYELDGKKMEADQLAGASGNLAVHVTTARNEAIDPAFYDSFMLQITFTLPGDVASDVEGEGATIAQSGEDATAAFTVLPGQDADFTLTAKVRDFKMPGAQIAALPYSSVVEMPDTSSMVSGMTNLSDAVGALAEGTSSLASGVDELTSGAQDLSSGAAAFGQGLNRLNGSSGQLVSASSQINAALSAVASGLQGADLSQLDQLRQLPGGLNALADGLAELRQQVVRVQQGYAQALPALEGAIEGIPAGTLTEEQIGSLMALASTSQNPDDLVTVNQLLGALAADAQSGGALAQQEAALRSMASALETAVGGGQLDQLSQLVEGIAQLSGEYGRFHEGLAQYASGLSALAENYGQLESGANQLAGGAGQLAGGAGELSSGMNQLNASTITLPETMKRQIADMTAEFDFPKFDPVSFVSPQNANVEAVQFVMTTAAIEQPETPEPEEPEQEQTIWDRFLALFQG